MKFTRFHISISDYMSPRHTSRAAKAENDNLVVFMFTDDGEEERKMESNLLMSISYSCMQNLLKIENPYHTEKLMECLLPDPSRDLISRFELTPPGFVEHRRHLACKSPT